MVPDGAGHTRLAVLLGAIGTAASLLVVAIAGSLPIPPPSGPSQLRVESVAVEPEAPGPTDVITVTARMQGVRSPTVVLGYAVQFGLEEARTVRMDRTADGEFSAAIGPFLDRAEIWLLVGASVGSFGPVVSDPLTFRVGVPTPGGRSTLNIERVYTFPDPPGFFGAVAVRAEVTSNATIQSAVLSFVVMDFDGAGGATLVMDFELGFRYVAQIPEVDFFGFASASGDRVVVAYRVAVLDEVGSRAVSAVGTYTLELPRLVP